MRTLTPAERRQLRAKAHHLHPFVSIGQHGLTPAVLHEIDVNLLAHELIKIRVFGDDRGARDALLERICAELDAAPVQHLGKILTIWRPAPVPEAPVAKTRATPRGREGKAGRPAQRAIGPRSGSAPAGPRARTTSSASPEARRRKPGPQGGRAAAFDRDASGRRRRAVAAPAGGTRRRRTSG
jgi:RNA-binding protein